MELRHLRYFIAVALEENVTRAAEKLHVSQPALSRQIRDLEEELGFALLERTAKSVSLTEAGTVFLEEASAVLERLEQGIKSAREVSLGESGEIHVGYAPSLTVRILPPTLRSFQSAFPNTKVKIHDLSSEEMQKGLRSESLDMAFLLETDAHRLPGIKFEALKKERLKIAVPNGHRWAGLDSVALSEMAGESLVGYSLEEYPEYAQLLRRVFTNTKLAEEHESVSGLVTAVEAGIGVALVTESFACVAGSRVTLVDLEPRPEPLVVGLAWIKESLRTVEAVFLEKARESCRAEMA